jgi:hypothetical protein
MNRIFRTAFVGLFLFFATSCSQANGQENSTTQSAAASRSLGTITTISGQSIILKTDAGAETTCTVSDTTKFLQLKPGQTSLKDATPISLSDLKAGDRVLVRGTAGTDGKSIQATSVIAMKQTDIADKQAHERAEWAQHSAGGLVKNVDTATGTITISTNAAGAQKEVAIHTTKQTILRRYAIDSVKFDDAKPAPLLEIKSGDQLRARGQRSPDGSELNADEIVSGTFRNIAGILVSSDNAAGTITVTDLATKQPLTLHITKDSQLRKLQPFMAQAIAARLKGAPAEGATGPNGNGAPGAPSANTPAAAGRGAGMGPGGSGSRAGFGPGASPGGGGQGGGRGDFQQMLSRMPAATASDFVKGDALMIVATEGSASTPSTIITLLGGVEPILQASSKTTPDMILSPWSLGGGGGGGEGATP